MSIFILNVPAFIISIDLHHNVFLSYGELVGVRTSRFSLSSVLKFCGCDVRLWLCVIDLLSASHTPSYSERLMLGIHSHSQYDKWNNFCITNMYIHYISQYKTVLHELKHELKYLLLHGYIQPMAFNHNKVSCDILFGIHICHWLLTT